MPKRRAPAATPDQPAFVAAVAEVLVPGGRLAIQTDHADYFEQIREVIGRESRLLPADFDVPEAGVREGRVETNFEIKYLREGRAIYQLAAQKPMAPEGSE
jgi:tRNA G46 methylase TrmB